MSLRRRHGNAARFGTVPVLETLPVDELPVGMPADAREVSPTDRGERGRFAQGNGLASAGGKAKAGKSRLAQRLGLSGALDSDNPFRPYRASAETWRRVTCTSIAQTVGGGFCGPIPSSMVKNAALCLAWSQYYFDAAALADDVQRGSQLIAQATKLAEASSSLVRQAHEYAAKEAIARGATTDPVADMRRRILGHD
jgi:hypothetical protein